MDTIEDTVEVKAKFGVLPLAPGLSEPCSRQKTDLVKVRPCVRTATARLTYGGHMAAVCDDWGCRRAVKRRLVQDFLEQQLAALTHEPQP